jgi:hypothetical protein
VLVVRGSLSTPQAIPVDTHAILDGKEVNFKLKPKDIIYVNSDLSSKWKRQPTWRQPLSFNRSSLLRLVSMW